jgi:hypothetical protein
MKMVLNKSVTVQFVEYMPDIMDQDILYISMKYSVAIHLCACGCGEKVVTPLSPDDWQLTYDGEVISLYPSIGNWDFNCQSHYWIINNKIKVARKWLDWEKGIGTKSKLPKKKIYNKRKES